MPPTQKGFRLFIYALVFFAGFANLATEIIGPRLVASLFGSTTIIWAIIISVTLVGISIGYFIGGRVPHASILRVLPIILIGNAIWLLLISWLIWRLPPDFTAVSYLAIGLTALVAFLPPALLFSMVSPLAIGLMSLNRPAQAITRDVGNIYALGTLGSVLGALVAAFWLIPWVGLTASLRLFSLAAVLFAIFLLNPRLRWLGLVLLVAAWFAPAPHLRLPHTENAVLLAEREGYYQTIRVYRDDFAISMDLGPTFQTAMRLSDGEPLYDYAADMIALAGEVRGKEILIIGGAGHTQARALERRGAKVTEVEIDPFVVELSDRYFGPMAGEVVINDGRAYLEANSQQRFDVIFVDAFDGLASAPVQLTTREFFLAAQRALKPHGRLIYNFIGVPEGERSNSFRALAATMASVFPEVRASKVRGHHLTNILLVAAQQSLSDLPYPLAPRQGVILTDDLNPIEIFYEQARAGEYFLRQ